MFRIYVKELKRLKGWKEEVDFIVREYRKINLKSD